MLGFSINLCNYLKNQICHKGVLNAFKDACTATEAATAFDKCKRFARDDPRA